MPLRSGTWLDVFARKDHRHLIGRHRQVRDQAIKDGYTPKSGLQARMWKLALIDAAETWVKYWEALKVEVRARVARRADFLEADRHYANWLLAGHPQFFECLASQAPAPKFPIDPDRRIKVMHFIRRAVRKLRGRNPMVRIARSAVFDANCYTAFEENGGQYVKLMGLKRGARIAVPLKGKTGIEGNIRLVFEQNGEARIHLTYNLEALPRESGATVGLDMGYTEAFVDSHGNAFGQGMGKVITEGSDVRTVTGKARNHLRAIARKAARVDPAKARRIRKNNLGSVKWNRREQKTRASLDRIINTGLNEIAAKHPGATIVTESLRHVFKSAGSRKMNRRLSSWVRGTLQDRVNFKGLAEGFRHVEVNAAYSSQECDSCGFVDTGNRKEDRFVCLHCGHEDHADRNGAKIVAKRSADREITRLTPYREVKAILSERYNRRLETKEGRLACKRTGSPRVTVQGRTPDTEPSADPRPGADMGRNGEASPPPAPSSPSESETNRKPESAFTS